MTVQELFTLTVGIMGITPANATSYNDALLPQVNTILAQTFNLENNNREFKGLTVLTSIPSVSSLSDVLTYQDNVLRKVVVWGLAQLLALSDDDVVKAGFFENRYADGMRLEGKFVASEITDYYALESDE